MGLFSRKKNNKIKEFNTKYGDVFDLIINNRDQNNKKVYNPYTSKSTQVEQIHKMYEGIVENGTEICKRIINTMAAQHMPHGVESMAIKVDNNDDLNRQISVTKDYIDQFIDKNNLRKNSSLALAKEKQKDGQVLIHLIWDSRDNIPIIDFISWYKTHYTIELATPESSVITGPFVCKYTKGDKSITYNDDDFVVSFDNRSFDDLSGYPTIGGILHIIENLSIDLANWRQFNKLFVCPIVNLKVPTQEDVTKSIVEINSKPHKDGQIMVTVGDFTYTFPEVTSIDCLYRSIETGIKIISCQTGIPPHVLGWIDLASNKSTTENIGETTEIEAYADISTEDTFYESLFNKIIRMRNKYLKETLLLENVVKPVLTNESDRKYEYVKSVVIPLVQSGNMSKRTMYEELGRLALEQEEMPSVEIPSIDNQASDDKFIHGTLPENNTSA
jgi:hypothetical protein